MADLMERLTAAAHVGMTASIWAELKPDVVAVHDPIGERTFGEINANANRIVRLLRVAGAEGRRRSGPAVQQPRRVRGGAGRRPCAAASASRR